MSLPGHRVTYEDYKLLPDDQRYEVLEGELVVTPAPNARHQLVSAELFLKLGAFVRSGRLGRVMAAPTDVILSEHNVLQPDILYVSSARLGIIDMAGGVRGAPDLVVEILSPSTASRDQIVKRNLYAQFGVHEYWVVDPAARVVSVLTEAQRGLETWRVFPEDASFAAPLLPGLSFPVRDIFDF